MSVSPCVFPGCDRDNGDPQLTDLGICEPCQWRYHRLLEWLVLDWVTLHATLPSPVRRGYSIRTTTDMYGHPREWASDTAADIANKMFWTADALAEHCGDKPPRRATREAGKIRIAYRYMEPRIPQLALMPDADEAAKELNDVHRQVRSALGKTRRATRLKGVPCIECNVCALILDGENAVCEDCGRVIERRLFGLLARHAIDTLIDEYDQEHAAAM